MGAIVGWKVTGKRRAMDTIGYRINGNVKGTIGGYTKVIGINLVNRYESACRVPDDSDEKLARSSGPI